MKILWLCNIMLPVIAEAVGREASNKEGWLSGLAEQILRHKSENNIQLGICFPIEKGSDPMRGEVSGIAYYGFEESTGKAEYYDSALESGLKAILEDFEPDVIHCFGTEYPHTLAMTKVCKEKDRLLIGIQGLCFKYADYYMANLPEKIQRRYLLRDFLKQDNLVKQQKKYVMRGAFEIEALKNTGNVTGRTDWDLQAAKEVNPEVKYHFMNETLRANFYGPIWEYEACEKYSVFLSQGNYPIKGLHFVLQALPDILRKYPETKVYVAGDVITRYESLMEKIKIGSYGKYCRDLIRKNKLEDKVIFLGRLNSAQMCDRYLKSNLFLSPSAIENSPNSVGEAMLLGMPVVSSEVGGVANMLKNGEEGLLYPYQDTEKLADAVCTVFEQKDKAAVFGQRARKHALITHDPETNYRRLVEIYEELVK